MLEQVCILVLNILPCIWLPCDCVIKSWNFADQFFDLFEELKWRWALIKIKVCVGLKMQHEMEGYYLDLPFRLYLSMIGSHRYNLHPYKCSSLALVGSWLASHSFHCFSNRPHSSTMSSLKCNVNDILNDRIVSNG